MEIYDQQVVLEFVNPVFVETNLLFFSLTIIFDDLSLEAFDDEWNTRTGRSGKGLSAILILILF